MRMLIIGAGQAGRRCAAAAARLDRIELVGIQDVDLERARALAHDARTDVMRNLDDACARARNGFAVICAPPGTHADMTAVALAHGLHVLVEKPFVTDLSDLDRIERLAARQGLVVGAIAQHRFAPAVRGLRLAVHGNAFGIIQHAGVVVQRRREASYWTCAPQDWRRDRASSGGGVLISIGIHYLDLLCWMLGDASGVAVTRLESEDGIESLIEATFTAGGVPCRVDARWGDVPPRPDTLQFVTASRAVTLRGDRVDHEVPGEPRDPVALHSAQISDFTAAIRSGRPPFVTPAEVRPALQLVHDLYVVADRGLVPTRR